MTPTCPDCGTETRAAHRSTGYYALRCRPCLLRMVGLPATFDLADHRAVPTEHPLAAQQRREAHRVLTAAAQGSTHGRGVAEGRQRRTHQGSGYVIQV